MSGNVGIGDPARPTLIVVDDEPEVLRSIYDWFRLDYRVLTFERGRDALDALRGEVDVHVLISDQRMPGMSGVEFLRHARELMPYATRLLMTGFADIKAVVDAINEGGVFRYLSKPCDPDLLALAVRQAVDQHDLIVEKKRLVADLTRTNARLVEANRLKSAFIEVASHELNTPVSVVLGMTELWRMSQAPAASASERDWVDRIHNAGRRLAGTVERMLKLLRADSLDRTLDRACVPLEPLVRRAVEDLQPYLRARGQHAEVVAHRDLGTAEVDAAKLHDILTNLLINAIKFTGDGGLIRVEAGPHPTEAESVRFTVADPGVGIPDCDRIHLFEPFFTGYDTLHHSSGDFQYCKRGIGLGLCLVKTFVELHGGSVWVQSTPGEGSSFSFTLPRRLANSRAARAPQPPTLSGSGVATGAGGGPVSGLTQVGCDSI